MRNLILLTFVSSVSVCWAEGHADTVLLEPLVHLDTAADLEQLRKTNPDHYARALRLMSSANALCKPGEPKLQNVDGRDISCALLLLTSNPPKRALGFMLDNIRYVAIVTVSADPPRLMHAAQR